MAYENSFTWRERVASVEFRSESLAEHLFDSSYPGDTLPKRTIKLLEQSFFVGLPPRPQSPGMPDFG